MQMASDIHFSANPKSKLQNQKYDNPSKSSDLFQFIHHHHLRFNSYSVPVSGIGEGGEWKSAEMETHKGPLSDGRQHEELRSINVLTNMLNKRVNNVNSNAIFQIVKGGSGSVLF